MSDVLLQWISQDSDVQTISTKALALQTEDPVEEEEDFSRFSYFPIDNPLLEGYRNKQLSVFWIARDVDFSGDRRDWRKLDAGTQRFTKSALIFFAQFDGLVTENAAEHFFKETSAISKSAGNFYITQQMVESIHNETYSIAIETIFSDPEEKQKAFNAIKHYPSLRKVADWALKWMRCDAPLPERIVAFACLEGVFFSSAFAAIYWLKQRNVLKGLTKANEYIARDEGIHTEFAMALYHTITSGSLKKFEPLSQERVHKIVSESVAIIEEFNNDALPVKLVGISASSMAKYVKFVADSLVQGLGYDKIWNIENPFPWMTLICLPNKSNFFETRVTEYTIGAAEDDGEFVFDLDVDY